LEVEQGATGRPAGEAEMPSDREGLKKTARILVSRHRPETSQGTPDPLSPIVVDLDNLVKHMSAPEFCKIGPVAMALIDAPGKAIFLTKKLF
jgi:hypothetical protein